MRRRRARALVPIPSATGPDCLVIGGGAAALCAAITARRAGASVLLAEQAPREARGGNTRHSRNLRLAHAEPTAYSLDRYPADEFLADLERATRGGADPALAQAVVDDSSGIVDWLMGAGVHLQGTAGGGLPPARRTAFLLGGGKAMINALYRTAEQLGVQIAYETAAEDLIIAADQPPRLRLRQRDHSWQLRPRTTVCCSGGAQANRRWLRAHWGEAADGFINRGTPFATGGVLEALLRQGAAEIGDRAAAYLVAVDARSPADDGGIVTRIRGMPLGIVVDRNGRRFSDEGADTASTRYAAWGRRLAVRPGQLAWLVLDAPGLASAPAALYPPIRAATIPELAIQLGIDAERFTETVSRYNAAVRPGADPDHDAGWHTEGLDPPKSSGARPLRRPPFAAYPMRPGITFTYHGVRVDEQTRVLGADGRPMPCLFAAGMIMAANIIPRGYLSGLALTIGIVFGRRAGAAAAASLQP
jgi:tricarballylate dehydrogenase